MKDVAAIKPQTSIIIQTDRNLVYTRQCLQSIFTHTVGHNYEVIVIVDSADEQTRGYLDGYTDEHPNFFPVLNSTPSGISQAYNLGVERACGESLIFMENDTVVTAGWLGVLLQHLDDPRVGLVCPATNASQDPCHIDAGYEDFSDLPVFAAQNTRDHHGQTIELASLTLFCAAMRKQVFDEIGRFDEGFTLGIFSGQDTVLRLRDRGYAPVCSRDAFVHHWSIEGPQFIGFERYWRAYQKDREHFVDTWETGGELPHSTGFGIGNQHPQQNDQALEMAFTVLEKERQITRLQKQLTDTFSSKGWKLLIALRKFQSWLVPPGSSRGELSRKYLHPIGSAMGKLSSSITARIERQRFTRARTRLADILSAREDAQDIFVFAPTLSWDVPLFQRPHQLALALARSGNLVFFCEPDFSDNFSPGFTRIQDRLNLVAGIDLNIFDRVSSPVVFTLAYNVEDLSHFDHPRIVYEYIDELSVLSANPEEMFHAHNQMLLDADVVTATADALHRLVRPFREDVVLCPNGVDFDFITTTISETDTPPEDIRELVERRTPIIGYYGALAEWVDYDLIEHAALKRPDIHILLIGPDYSDAYRFKQILKNSNITWLGVKPYRQIPRYLKYFDVGTIPFLLNETTHSTSPLKLYEYMSAAKPVVTTAMRECKKYDTVLIATGKDDYIEKLDVALELREDSGYTTRSVQIAQSNTWDQRAQTIIDAVRKLGGNHSSADPQSGGVKSPSDPRIS